MGHQVGGVEYRAGGSGVRMILGPMDGNLIVALSTFYGLPQKRRGPLEGWHHYVASTSMASLDRAMIFAKSVIFYTPICG